MMRWHVDIIHSRNEEGHSRYSVRAYNDNLLARLGLTSQIQAFSGGFESVDDAMAFSLKQAASLQGWVAKQHTIPTHIYIAMVWVMLIYFIMAYTMTVGMFELIHPSRYGEFEVWFDFAIEILIAWLPGILILRWMLFTSHKTVILPCKHVVDPTIEKEEE